MRECKAEERRGGEGIEANGREVVGIADGLIGRAGGVRVPTWQTKRLRPHRGEPCWRFLHDLLGRSFRRSTPWGERRSHSAPMGDQHTQDQAVMGEAGRLDVVDGRARGRDGYVRRARGVKPARSKSARSEPTLLGFMSTGQMRLLNETAPAPLAWSSPHTVRLQ